MSDLTLWTITETIAWLNAHTRGKTWSRRRVDELIAVGEFPTREVGGRVYVVNLPQWLERGVKVSTDAARDPEPPAFVPQISGPRRFSSARRPA